MDFGDLFYCKFLTFIFNNWICIDIRSLTRSWHIYLNSPLARDGLLAQFCSLQFIIPFSSGAFDLWTKWMIVQFCSLFWFVFRSLWVFSFGKYHGAPVIIVNVFDWNLCNILCDKVCDPQLDSIHSYRLYSYIMKKNFDFTAEYKFLAKSQNKVKIIIVIVFILILIFYLTKTLGQITM